MLSMTQLKKLEIRQAACNIIDNRQERKMFKCDRDMEHLRIVRRPNFWELR